MGDFKVELDMENFGPQTKMHFDSKKIHSMKIGIFANNGIGKTFISRGFRLPYLINNSIDVDTNNILTNNQNRGIFRFKITEKDNTTKTLEIQLKRNFKPKITNNTGYFFHVFNSDYVADNLEEYDYKPSGEKIKGYILGKKFIDVSKEKKRLQTLAKEKSKIQLKIENGIKKGLETLDSLGINKNTTEYKRITFANVVGNLDINEDESFDTLVKDRNQLESMPDGLSDIKLLYFNMDISPLSTTQKLLSTKYHKSDLDPEFVDKIKSNQTFIENGIDLYDQSKNECPFCHQYLEHKAIELISSYNDYLKDAEAQTVKSINRTIIELEDLKSSIESKYHEFNVIKNNFNDIKQYFPSLKKSELLSLDDNQMVLYHIDELIKKLTFKKEDINSTNFQFKTHISQIETFLEKLKINFEIENKKILSLNEIKKSSGKEKMQLKRRLCNRKYLDIKIKQETNIQEILNLDSEISLVKKDIIIKENKSRIDRRKTVVKSLQHFLDYFFNGKYSFHEKEFCITFDDEKLSSNASYFLSDGEKGIVAFCYYLATVHTIVEKEDDYENMFFVIDDPISSMDFEYVFKVAKCITDLNSHFEPKSKFNRFIILTHSTEFMNLLMRNNLICQKYILKKNKINKFNKKIMLPYENHLDDLVKISLKKEDPSHTTPNSIRHVLETISNFEHQNKNLYKFVQENEILNEKSYIYTLMQDLSHGRLRLQDLSDDELSNACEIVIKFIWDKYPGQLEKYKSSLKFD